MENFNDLLREIGRPYEMFNEDGTYQGCFYPVQKLYPDRPKYKLPSKNQDRNYIYGINKLKKHCEEINYEDLKKGDIIATKFRNELHVAVYYEYDKIIHVFKGHTLQIGRLNLFKNEIKYFRVI